MKLFCFVFIFLLIIQVSGEFDIEERDWKNDFPFTQTVGCVRDEAFWARFFLEDELFHLFDGALDHPVTSCKLINPLNVVARRFLDYSPDLTIHDQFLITFRASIFNIMFGAILEGSEEIFKIINGGAFNRFFIEGWIDEEIQRNLSSFNAGNITNGPFTCPSNFTPLFSRNLHIFNYEKEKCSERKAMLNKIYKKVLEEPKDFVEECENFAFIRIIQENLLPVATTPPEPECSLELPD